MCTVLKVLTSWNTLTLHVSRTFCGESLGFGRAKVGKRSTIVDCYVTC